LKYLEKQWTEKEARSFVKETNRFFELLKENPYMLEATSKHKNLFRGPINRLTILTYRYKPGSQEIIIVNIRETRRKPLE